MDAGSSSDISWDTFGAAAVCSSFPAAAAAAIGHHSATASMWRQQSAAAGTATVALVSATNAPTTEALVWQALVPLQHFMSRGPFNDLKYQVAKSYRSINIL